MLSRVAENIYWMARHLERVENTARLVGVHSETRLDHPEPAELAWETVLRITGTLADFDARGLSRTEQEAANFLLSDPQNPASVLSTLSRARENHRILLEILPRESWEEMNELHQVAARPGASDPDQRGEHLREIMGRAQAMAGLFLSALNHDEGYALLRLGRTIERGDIATRVMLGHFTAVEHGSTDSQSLRGADWVGVLRSLTAFQMYRRSVQGPVTGQRVVRFLTCSTVFPRAIAFCAKEAEQALGRLPDSGPLIAAAARLTAVLTAEHCVSGSETSSSAVLAMVQAELSSLHDMMVAAYFVPRVSLPAQARQTQSQRS